ncbi:E3 ubiquitin-protein ligase RNF169 [Erythrolamprus reginae]|uniref:E3 ubiquitin-protein ligase RNF169 n=1 Tax=Erythrolamprus reginae TaxID=121349 RepID=UPI00396CA50F
MAAAALGPGGRAAGSAVLPLRRGRGRRRRDDTLPADDDAAPEAPARRSGQREGPARDPGPARDFIFRTPITLPKHGEVHEEHKSHLRKLRHEKWQEERNPEDLIHKLMVDDAEVDRRWMDDPKKEESLMARVSHECFPECLSDSENEEPSQCRPLYQSAFVSKGSAYSIALLAGNFSCQAERSQSCSDALGHRSKSRQRSAPVRAKAHPSAGASVSLVGVLSSTQNNRCLSAPDLTSEKRLVSHQVPPLFPILPRQERSISPESNDSISEELNHFKPIVCSPCTPPKQLPDGRVLSPLIIKSTPRNLTRSLQKPTTYEASPRILKKWEQILQERQVKKTLSKATLTSSVPEPVEDFLTPNFNIPIKCPLQTSSDVTLLDSLPPSSLTKLNNSANGQRDSEALEMTPRVFLSPRPTEKPPDSRFPELPEAKSVPRLTGPCLHVDAKTMPRKIIRVNSASENGALGNKPCKCWDESELRCLSNGLRLERGLGEETPSLRRGQKRPCKTKHLDPSVKRLRPSARCRKVPPMSDPLKRQRRRQRGRTEQRLQQEEADRQLAVQLQRQFEREVRTAERSKGRADQYFLRSKNATGAK